MKTIVGFALLFCVATAVGKPARPQDLPKCLEGAWYEFAAKNEACSNKIMEMLQNQKVNDSYIGSLCASACAKEANDYMRDKCGVMSLADVFCSKDPRDQHYCFTYNKTVTTYQQLIHVLHGPCANKDCSDPTCNAAFKNLTCCAKESKDFYLDIYGYFPIPLPGNCVFPVKCAKTERLDITKILLQN
ncbi:uncharacterized protein LOC135349497 isoform X2 [Halichondria panicea]|uniref:uncharacterized protein LOC135349497 isoform X2 n=1 Tax=Halichondria panicea TaxID=6063 RepID=UPI00312B9B9C